MRHASVYLAFYLANPTIASFLEDKRKKKNFFVSSNIVVSDLSHDEDVSKEIIARTRPNCDRVSQIIMRSLFAPPPLCILV